MPLDKSKVGALSARLGPSRLQRDVPLAPFTTFRIGGPADLFLKARTPEDLVEAVTAATRRSRELGG